MRSLLVTRNFPPLVGGMERVSLEICRALESAGPCELVGPRGSRAFAPAGVQVRDVPLRPLLRFLAGATISALRGGLAHRPDVVVAGSGLTAPLAWAAARLAGARCVVYVHGLDVITLNRVYQTLWIPFLRACDVVICNSQNTRRLAESRGIRADSLVVINPGTSVPDHAPGGSQGAFRDAFGLGAGPLLLSVGRFTKRKGLAEFVQKGLPPIVADVPAIQLVVVGEEASDALQGGSAGQRERILAAAERAGVRQHVRFVGRCDEELLKAAYDDAACHVFPILDLPGDVEGFGMVALEAAAHGLETVAFRVGGVPDAVSEESSGVLIDPGDYTGFAQAVIRIVRDPPGLARRAAAQRFALSRDWATFCRRFLEAVA